MAKRVFLVVLDSFGVGEEPDAASFGDYGVNTLRSIAQSSSFNCPNLRALGLFNLDGIDFLPSFPKPLGAFGRLRERSMGKDTTIGHWELAGLESSSPLPTYPHGFPPEIIQKFEQRTGRSVLCNTVFRYRSPQGLRRGTPAYRLTHCIYISRLRISNRCE